MLIRTDNLYPAQKVTAWQMGKDQHRLPCRGCTRDCSNYERCNGTPWRMNPDAQPFTEKSMMRIQCN